MIITAGKTSVSVYVYFVDDDGGTAPGEPTTGLLFSDIDTGGSASYVRQGAARVDLTLITLASASAAHADGGFILVDDTNMPGLYRVDFPNAAIATGVDQVFILLVAASGKNTVMRPVAIDITDVDLRDAVRGGMTALPNAVADAAGGLPISDLGGLDLDAMNTNINDIETDTGTTLQAELDGIQADTENIQSRLPTALVSGRMDSSIDATGFEQGAIDNVWDEVLTGGTHNVSNSAGRRLRQLEAAALLHEGTAQAATSNTLTLDTGASTIDNFYGHTRVVITENTGVEQERIIVSYVGSTRVATIAPPWATTPDATSVFEVEPGLTHAETNSKTVRVGLAQAGAAGTVTLDAGASSINEFYTDDVVTIDSGTGEGQERIITAYNGTTKVATIEPNWITNPDTTSEFIVEEALAVADVFSISHDPTAADNLELDYDGTGYDKSNSTIGTATANTDMRGTDSAALASVCTEGRLAELDAANLPTVTDGIQTDLDNATDGLGALKTLIDTADTAIDVAVADLANGTDGLGALKTLIDALNDISTANVLTQVNTALDTAITELAVAIPSATPSLRTATMLMYMALRNKLKVQTSGVDALEVHNDAGTLITKKLITDDGTDLTEAKMS